jgi:hypothetical protein
MHSPVLSTQLARLASDGDTHPRIRIKLPDTHNAVAEFKDMLTYMYCGTCQITSHSVSGLLHMSNYYEVRPGFDLGLGAARYQIHLGSMRSPSA